MFSRNSERSAHEPRPAPPQGVRDVSPPTIASAPAVPDGVSVVARSDRLEGTLTVTDTLLVLGTITGTVAAMTVHVEEGARVDADISADEVVIGGEYTGKLTCRQRLEVRATGRVSGTVEAFRLMLHEGGSMDGELHMLKQPGAVEPENVRASVPPRGGGVSEASVRVPVGAVAAAAVESGAGRGASAPAAIPPGAEASRKRVSIATLRRSRCDARVPEYAAALVPPVRDGQVPELELRAGPDRQDAAPAPPVEGRTVADALDGRVLVDDRAEKSPALE